MEKLYLPTQVNDCFHQSRHSHPRLKMNGQRALDVLRAPGGGVSARRGHWAARPSARRIRGCRCSANSRKSHPESLRPSPHMPGPLITRGNGATELCCEAFFTIFKKIFWTDASVTRT